MKKLLVSASLLAACLTASGCAYYLTPNTGPYERYRMLRHSSMVPTVDPDTAARGRWDRVMRLRAGAIIDVLTMNGTAYVGKIAGTDASSVRVIANGIEEQIARAEVLRVDLVDLPGSEVGAVAKRAAGGALLGLGAVALVGGVIGGDAWPPPAVALRAGAAAGGVAGGQAALIARQASVVYVAESQVPPLRTARSMPAVADSQTKSSPDATETRRVIASHSADDWSSIVALRPQIAVVVLTTGGARHYGSMIVADAASIRIDLDGADLRIPRASVARVDVLETQGALACRCAARRWHIDLSRSGGSAAGVTRDKGQGTRDNGSASLRLRHSRSRSVSESATRNSRRFRET